MQIESLKISNLLSFPYIENFETADKIFFSDEKV
jgi:hypothetical protein